MDFDLDRLPVSDLEALARRLLVRAAGTVPGPSPEQLAELTARIDAGRDGTATDIDAIATELDRVHEPGMGGMFRFDAERTVSWVPRAADAPEVAPGVYRVLMRNFAHAVYFAEVGGGRLPLAVMPDLRTKLWWHDMPARAGCAPENA